MSYSKNLPVWERVVRVLAGAAMVGGGILWMGRSMPLGIVLAVAGLIAAVTGFVGFCPMCALAGRRLKS